MSQKSIYNKIKEVANHSVIYGFGSVMQVALGFILIPLYTHYMEPDVYGILTILTICGTSVALVFWLGIPASLSRSYFDYAEGNERKRVVSTSLYLCLVGACAQITLGFVLKEELSLAIFHTDAYSIHIFIILISSAFGFLNELLFVILRFEKKSKQVVLVNFLYLTTSITLIASLLIIFQFGIMAPIVGLSISQALLFCVLFNLTKKSFCLDFSKHELIIQIRFGVPVLITGLSFYLLTTIDRMLINKFLSLDDVGVYSIGFLLGSSINIFLIMPFNQIWSAMRMEYLKDDNAQEFYKLITTYFFMTGLLITVSISIFAKEIIMLISSPDYLSAYKIVPMVMFAFLIKGGMGLIDNGIYFSRKVVYHTYIFIGLLFINLTLNYTLIPIFGYVAGAYSILLTFVIGFILVYYISNKLLKIKLESERLFKVFISSGFVLMLGLLLTESDINLIIGLSLKLLMIISLVCFWYLFVVSKIEKEKLLSFVTQ